MEKFSLLLLFLLLRVSFICVGEYCESSSVGYALVDSPFKTTAVRSPMECIHRCAIHERCASVNIRYWTSKSRMRCELHDHTRAESPQSFQKQPHSTYLEVLREAFENDNRNACSSGIFCGHFGKCEVYQCRCLEASPRTQVNAARQGERRKLNQNILPLCYPFTPKSDQFLRRRNRNTRHSMKNLAFHSLLR